MRLAVVNRGLLGFIGAPTYRLLHDTTQRELFRVLVQNRIPHTFRAKDDELILHGLGSRIILRSLDDPNRLIGTNLAWFALDELTYVQEEAYHRLNARLRERHAKELCGIAGCTPKGFNWVYDLFFGDKRTDQHVAIKAAPFENAHNLAPGYYENLAKTYDPRFYRQEVLGEYLSLQRGSAYYAFDRTRNVNPDLERDHGCRLVWSLDFNISPMSSVIGQLRFTDGPAPAPPPERPERSTFAPHAVAQKPPRIKSLEILDEISLLDANVDLACEEFRARTLKWVRSGERLTVNVYGDPAGNSRNHAGKSDWQMVREYFARYPEYQLVFNVPAAHPAVRDRVNAVNGALFNSLKETRLTHHPRCTVLTKDFERVTWGKDSHGNSTGDLYKGDPELTHMSDALGYLVAKELPLADKIRISVL